MCSKSRSRVSTLARQPEDYVSQSAERGTALSEASPVPLRSLKGPALDSDLARGGLECQSGSKPDAFITANILKGLQSVLPMELLPPG